MLYAWNYYNVGRFYWALKKLKWIGFEIVYISTSLITTECNWAIFSKVSLQMNWIINTTGNVVEIRPSWAVLIWQLVTTCGYLNLNSLKFQIELKFSCSATIAIFQVVNKHRWLVATILNCRIISIIAKRSSKRL